MNKENSEAPEFNKKMCTRCSCKKKKADFCHSHGTNPLYEYSTCNKCYEKRKNKNAKKEIDPISRKKKKLEDNLILTTPIPQSTELDSRLVESIFPEFQPNTCNLTTIKENFHQLVNILTLPIEYGSGYYWEIRQMHLVTRKKEFTGCAMVYLGCIQREDRKWKRPQNTPVKRRSEAHAAINRYDCMEIFSHQQTHEHPQYRKGVFLEVAKHWIQKNVKYNLQNPELYKHLQYHKLINAQIHAKEQVYYWASVFSKRIYMFNSENQLSSVKEYLKEHSCFKTICYLENDFIKALGFTTPLFNRIGHLISKII
ncbi:hypothetical protein RhiirA4_472863 [Rhizophagus irregularis]|uniref:Uncharacterized protein n=1 Tax=Rhizophagus irregularis TaxID=588596 RepID=A0A2I1H5T5_9GLOM|nr:hypothetical protein RhiirA4_472863 [Rhizophagus irregularis]